MRLPWVSREAYDTACACFSVERTRFDKLLEKFTALRLQGATIPEPQVQREKKEPDALTQAVLNASLGKPPQVRAMMMKQLAEDKEAVKLGFLTDADVLRRIENGFTADDVGIPE